MQHCSLVIAYFQQGCAVVSFAKDRAYGWHWICISSARTLEMYFKKRTAQTYIIILNDIIETGDITCNMMCNKSVSCLTSPFATSMPSIVNLVVMRSVLVFDVFILLRNGNFGENL